MLILIRIIAAAVIAVTTFSGCDANDTNEEQNQKHMSLSEYLSETKENWFLTGKKKYTVQAMMVSIMIWRSWTWLPRTMEKLWY